MSPQEALEQANHLALVTIANRCKTDLYYLCKYVLQYKEMELHVHEDICDYTKTQLPNQPINYPHSTPPLDTHTTENESTSIDHSPEVEKNISEEQGENEETDHQLKDSFSPEKNFNLFLMPRGTFKSSVVTIGFSLQYLLNDQNARILIDSETFAKCTAFLSEIKGHLESNDKFRAIYKALYGDYPDSHAKHDVWTNSELNISARQLKRKEPTFTCGGIGTTKTGMHYDLIICDDLVSENNVTNKEQIDKVIEHYRLALSLLDPGKPLIVIGTRWDYNDLYQFILDFEEHRFNVLVRKAIKDDGSLLFPERLTQKFLDDTKKSQGSYIFSCQYQNEPVDNETAPFKRSWFQTIEWDQVKDRPIKWFMAVDPSFEGASSDYTAFVVAGMDFERNIYVKHVLRRKMTYAKIIDFLFDYNNRFEPQRIALETVAMQKSLQYELNNEQKRRGTWLRIVEIKSRSKSKEERIMALTPLYEFGHIYHIKECPQREELEYELVHFPRGTHDDVIDALATILEIAQPASNSPRESNKESRSELYDLLTKPRSPMTGI